LIFFKDAPRFEFEPGHRNTLDCGYNISCNIWYTWWCIKANRRVWRSR